MALPWAAVATQAFTAAEDDELDLAVGDLVEVLRSLNDTWAQVRFTGRGSLQFKVVAIHTGAVANSARFRSLHTGPVQWPHGHLPARVCEARGLGRWQRRRQQRAACSDHQRCVAERRTPFCQRLG